MTLVDTNVLLDLVTADPVWADWSRAELTRAAAQGRLEINGIVYAELSTRYARIEALDAMLKEAAITITTMPRAALFLAGKAFLHYRKHGGTRTGVLPDLFIGAHAAVTGLPLLTRDAGRYRTYFPTIRLLVPQTF